MSAYSESYWKRREEADEEREGGEMVLPEMDFSGDDKPRELETAEPQPLAAPAVTSQTATQTDAETVAAPPVAPKAPAADPTQAARLKAIERIQRMADAPMGGPSDSDIAAASQRDRDNVRRANLSETLRAAFARDRPRLQQEPSEAAALQSQRASSLAKRNADMSVSARLAEALSRGTATPQKTYDDPYHQALTEQALSLAEDRRRKGDAAGRTAETETAALETERQALLADPRAKRMGLTPEMLAKADRAALKGIRHELESFKPEKTKAPIARIKAGDIGSVPERRAGYRELVKAIAEGRAEAPKAASRFGSEVVSDVLAYKPDFDATRFGAYKKVVEQQAGGKDVVAIDVAREHLGTAKSLIPRNASPQFVNRIKQAIASGTGDPEFKPFIAAATVAAHELAKVYGIEDQAGKAMVEHQLAAAQSPEQLVAVFTTFEELIAGKQRGLERQRARVAPSGEPPPTGEKKTPSGKPYVKRQVSKSSGRIRYLDAAGAVVEESDG